MSAFLPLLRKKYPIRLQTQIPPISFISSRSYGCWKEWIDFFEDRYYSFSLTGSNFDNPLLSYFNYWPEDLPLDVDTLIYSCFAEPEFARNPNLLALQRLRELINAPDAEQNLSYTERV